MLSKEKFVEIINFIKKQDELQSKFCDILEEMSPNCYADAFVYNDYENVVIDLLNTALGVNENDKTIQIFICDLNYGKNYTDGCFVDDKTLENIDISTPEKLYDYLVKDRNELLSSIKCALTHDISVCEECKKCEGKNCAEIKVNLLTKVEKL